MIRRIWCKAKKGFSLRLGALKVLLKFEKIKPVSNNPHRGISGWFKQRARTENSTAKNHHYNDLQPIDALATNTDHTNKVAIIIGAGNGFGAALAKRLAQEKMRIVMLARDTKKLEHLLPALSSLGGKGYLYAGDATDENTIKALFKYSAVEIGTPDLVIVNVEAQIPGGILDIETAAFEHCWRANCLSYFLAGREAAQYMTQKKSGTVIFTGITASVRSNSGYINMAVGKFGTRALAQAMAKELGPQGIHIIHTILDAGILGEDSNKKSADEMSDMQPGQLAETYYQLYNQHRSAWTHELDLRPWVEQFG